METNIYLVRHAHSKYSSDEVNRPLSKKGLEERSAIEKVLLEVEIDKLISSPYKRAIQTIEHLAKILKKEIEIRDEFKERKVSLEKLENFHDFIKKSWVDEDLKKEDCESAREARERGRFGIEKIICDNWGQNIVIGTHGNIMALILSLYDEKYGYEFWKSLDMPAIYCMRFHQNGSIGIKHL